MKRLVLFTVLLLAPCIVSVAQSKPSPKGPAPAAKPATNTPDDIAKATLSIHGGDKLRKLKSLVMKGSVDLSFMGQAVPGAFSTAISGEKYFFDINTPVQQLKQVYDGRELYSSIPGFSLPPVTGIGFPIIARIGDSGYVVTALPDGSKKKKGFRLTTPEGFYTDFFVSDKTGQIKGYESAFETSGRVVTTSVEIDEFQTVDGIVVPKKYSQRFDLGQIVAYANFKTKDILVNSKIEDSAFEIPR
ncbi:MAG: hypothetical protein WBO10_01845 [Pyrinomonadaceae bacterium]